MVECVRVEGGLPLGFRVGAFERLAGTELNFKSGLNPGGNSGFGGKKGLWWE